MRNPVGVVTHGTFTSGSKPLATDAKSLRDLTRINNGNIWLVFGIDVIQTIQNM
jgi:hypothetical protein